MSRDERRAARRIQEEQRILHALPPVLLAGEQAHDHELKVAAAEIDRRHQDERAGEKAFTTWVFDLIRQHAGDHVEICDRIGDDAIGIVLENGGRFYLTTEST